MTRNWEDLPANAQTIATIESCLDCLQKRHPYPSNMIPDRINFAVARLGYSAAIHILETFMCELTEEIKLEEMTRYTHHPCFGQFWEGHTLCKICNDAIECQEKTDDN